MRKLIYTSLLVPGLLMGTTCLLADSSAQTDAEQSSGAEAANADYQAMRIEAEKARAEAESARQEATRIAEAARELARLQEREAREQRERGHQDREEMERVRDVQRAEMEKAREDLSRAHRELREASREVARAHRDLSRSDREYEITTELNLGDRAVIGVVLGRQSDNGVEIMGVSPDGPAERAGLQPGDVVESINGQSLANDGEARQNVFQIMRDVGDGEELVLTVARDGEVLEYTVTAEQREPRGWQSIIRIPEAPAIAEIPESPEAPNVIIETIEVPDIDEAALAAEIAELAERIEGQTYRFVTKDGKTIEQFHFDTDDFSELGSQVMNEANIWFGLPLAQGLELAAMNKGLGSYFKTDHGVLVIKAKEDNAYTLESGDVILSVDSAEVNSPSDLMRALRDAEPGAGITIKIKRNRKDKTLSVAVPENRLGYR